MNLSSASCCAVRWSFPLFDGRRKSDGFILRAGDGVFINSAILHSARALEPETELAGLVFPISFFDIRPFAGIHQKSILPVTECGVAGLAFRAQSAEDQPLLACMRELCAWSEDDACFELHCIEMVCRIWRLLSARVRRSARLCGGLPATGAREQRLKEMVSYVRAHFRERITVEDLARHACVSRTECFRCFQSVMGKSPMAYIAEYRLSMAAMLLANTRQSVAEIALSCGFCSPSYFGKLFRQECGLSPRRYRENAQKTSS